VISNHARNSELAPANSWPLYFEVFTLLENLSHDKNNCVVVMRNKGAKNGTKLICKRCQAHSGRSVGSQAQAR
jgi:hypothetical protein